MNARKYPRTLNEAFGPYTSPLITETDRPMDWQDIVVIAGSVVCIVTIALILVGGWL